MTSAPTHPTTTPNPCVAPCEGRRARPSQGVALLVVLMFLLVITGISLYSARFAVVSESASRNQMSNEMARQAAEAALRDAERDVFLVAKASGARCDRVDYGADRFTSEHFGLACPQGQCEPPSMTETREWSDDTAKSEHWWPKTKGGRWNDTTSTKVGTHCTFSGGVPLGTFTGAAPLVGVALQPEYLLELMQRGDSRFFRITARGFGFTTDTQVVLQSYLKYPS